MIKKLMVAGSMLMTLVLSAQETVTRNLPAFSKLSVGGSFEVSVEQGTGESVKIVAEGVNPDKIISEVKDNTLEVYLEKGQYRNIKIKVYITYKNLEAIDKSGSGNLTCHSELSANKFSLNTSGSGNITVNKKIKAEQVLVRKDGSGNMTLGALETNNADLSFSGSGNINIADGQARRQSIQLSGSGNVSAYGLKSDECIASLTGSGSIDVSVNNSLEGVIAGSGSITYQGNAQVTKQALMGSGRISRK